MPDKRSYDRTRIAIGALLYDCRENKEITCEVDNISERGICFKVPVSEPGKNSLKVGETLTFQFVDKIMETHDEMSDIIVIHKCMIRHITETPEYLIIGCYLTEAEFEKYVIRRRLALLMMREDD